MKRIILLCIILTFLTGCNWSITPSPIAPTDNEITYRALLIGVGDYIGEENDLASPTYSVDMMHQILRQCRFGLLDTEFSIINSLKDSEANKKAILKAIDSTFSKKYFLLKNTSLIPLFLQEKIDMILWYWKPAHID